MKIIQKEILADIQNTRLVKFVIESPAIASNARPGQFVVLMPRSRGERIPLTIVDSNPQNGTITIIVQEAGFSTKLLGTLAVGDSLYSLTGPLGHPTPIRKYGKILMVGGGVGIAELFPIVRALKQAGNTVYSILGARTKDLLILKDDIAQWSDNIFVATDDGSFGEKGFVSDILKNILAHDPAFNRCYCVGPVPMMRVVSEVTRPYAIKTDVCLNAIMLDGTGMCGCCRVTEAGNMKFCCVDGPDFDGHLVDFDDLISRLKRFIPQEKHALEVMHSHACRCKK